MSEKSPPALLSKVNLRQASGFDSVLTSDSVCTIALKLGGIGGGLLVLS